MFTKPEWLEQYDQYLNHMRDVYVAKNHDYGDSFTKMFKEEGFALSRIKLGDKMERFKTLTRSENGDQLVNDESIEDTLIDMANYAIMSAIAINNEKMSKDDFVFDCGDISIKDESGKPISGRYPWGKKDEEDSSDG